MVRAGKSRRIEPRKKAPFGAFYLVGYSSGARVLINQINFFNFASYLKDVKVLPHCIGLHSQET